jgi:hypothetical protein
VSAPCRGPHTGSMFSRSWLRWSRDAAREMDAQIYHYTLQKEMFKAMADKERRLALGLEPRTDEKVSMPEDAFSSYSYDEKVRRCLAWSKGPALGAFLTRSCVV